MRVAKRYAVEAFANPLSHGSFLVSIFEVCHQRSIIFRFCVEALSLFLIIPIGSVR